MWLRKFISSIIAGFKKRLPPWTQVITVFSFVLFLAAGYSIYSFLFNLPSSLYYFNTFEIISVFSYILFFTLFESLLVSVILVALSVILPGKWFKDGFVYKASLVTLAMAFASIRLQDAMFMNNIPPLRQVVEGAIFIMLACAILILLLQKILILQKIFVNVVERFEIFAYIYVPLGLIGSIIVLMRNLFQWQR